MYLLKQVPVRYGNVIHNMKTKNTKFVSLQNNISTVYRSQKKDKYIRKCKGRRCCLGDKIIHFLAALAVMLSSDYEEQDELILFFKLFWCNSSYSSNRPSAKLLTWRGIQQILYPKQQLRPLPFHLYLSFFYVTSI